MIPLYSNANRCHYCGMKRLLARTHATVLERVTRGQLEAYPCPIHAEGEFSESGWHVQNMRRIEHP